MRGLPRFKQRFLGAAGGRARRRARKLVPSRTLRRAMQVQIVPREWLARVHIPHYWAVYLHDGTGRIFPRRGTWLVFFENPADDPRTDGGRNYPVRRSDVRSMWQFETKWREAKEENRRRRAAGQRPFMIFVRSRAPLPRTGFFDEGMVGFVQEADQVVKPLFAELVLLNVINDKDEAVIRL